MQTIASADSIHPIKVKDIDGKEMSLENYKGKVLLVVNVASKCGLTPQYNALEAAHQKGQRQKLFSAWIPVQSIRWTGTWHERGN